MKTLQVRFETPDALRAEFKKNISNRGIFVASEESFEARQTVRVEVVLSYVSASEVALSLVGEVVHCVPAEMAASGAIPGVAIQFEASASQLVEEFEPLLGQAPIAELDVDDEADQRRGARRGAVRVPVRVMPTMSPPFEATSRDLSATGILLSMNENALPVGEVVRVCLWHPSGEPCVEIDGRVVREVATKSGEVAAAAVAFDRQQAADPTTREVIDALRHAGHRSRLGGISGALADLGLANMLQMFGSSAPCGTLVVEFEGEQGWIAFRDGRLLEARLGARSGRDAIIEMLGWGDGRFEFAASVDAKLTLASDAPSLTAVVLDAVCARDELDRDAADDVDEDDDDEVPEIDFADATLREIEVDSDGIIDEAIDEDVDIEFDIVDGLDDVEDVDEMEDVELAEEGVAEVAAPSDLDAAVFDLQIDASTTFAIDPEQEASYDGTLEKSEEAVLELAKAGMNVGRLESIIPEAPERIQAAIVSLIERGVIFPNP